MADDADFHYSDQEWNLIATELEAVGRLRYEGDRQSIEMSVNVFVSLRPVLGRMIPTPGKAAKAWLRVAKAADALSTAINELRAAGAADLALIEAQPGAAKKLAENLPVLAAGARNAAELEKCTSPRVANNEDPLRDEMVRGLLAMYASFGGAARASVTRDGTPSGPAIRFLQATTGPAMRAVGEEAISANSLRDMIRRGTADMVN